MIVIDTSVAVKWLVAEMDSDKARVIEQSERTLCAPYLITSELTNVLLKREQAGDILAEQVGAGLPLALETIGNFVDERSLLSETLTIARRFSHSSYDCFFLACALGRGVLVTADMKFANKISDFEYRKHIVTLDKLTPDTLDMAVAACSISRELQRRIEFMGTGAPGAIQRAVRAAGQDSRQLLLELSDIRDELWLHRFVTEVSSLQPGVARDLVSLFYLGSDGRTASDWQAAKSEAEPLISYGLANMPEPAGFRAANVSRGLRIAFETYLPTTFFEPDP